MQIKKQDINIGKAIFEGTIKTEAEGSIIVPDTKGDILKVLQADAECFVCDKQISDGKITVSGKVRVNIIYVPEEGCGCIESLAGVFDFCETLRKSEFSDDMKFMAVCDIDKVTYRLINSRKISVLAKVLVAVEVFSEENHTIISDIEHDCVQTKKKYIEVSSIDDVCDLSFSVSETFDLSHIKNGVQRILKYSMEISEKEYKALSGKLVVKGKICICMLYEDMQGKCAHSEFEIPFTEVLDIDNLDDSYDCEIIYENRDTKLELVCGEDGDSKNVAVSLSVGLSVKCEKKKEIEMLCDCYFTDSDCEIKNKKIDIQNVCEKIDFSAVIKEVIEKEENAPAIFGVYQAVAKPYITEIEKRNGKIQVGGKVRVYILYTCDGGEMPVHSISEEIPFNYLIDLENKCEDAQVMLMAECDHISYNLQSECAVEVRIGIKIFGKLVEKSTIPVICDVEAKECGDKDNALVVYFVKGNESIWDIGKEYRAKCDDIREYNGITDEIKPGDKLIIPQKR